MVAVSICALFCHNNLEVGALGQPPSAWSGAQERNKKACAGRANERGLIRCRIHTTAQTRIVLESCAHSQGVEAS